MAALTYRAYGLKPPMQSDFDFVWLGLRAFVHGENPYRAVADAHVRGPLYYPLPALVALAPLGLVSAAVARIVFAGLGYAALAYAAAGRKGGLFVGLFSASAIIGGRRRAVVAAADGRRRGAVARACSGSASRASGSRCGAATRRGGRCSGDSPCWR